MHTLFPPLQDKEERSPRTDSDTDSTKTDDNVLSQELKENFDTMRALLSESHEDPRQEESIHNSRKRKREAQAVKTALAAESEIARLKGGIAELEALLLETGSEEVPLVAFPSLPPIVVPDEQHEEPENKTGKLVQG